MTGDAVRTSSFYLPLRFLSAEKRQAMHTLYAFCRRADDAADVAHDKQAALLNIDGLRADIARIYAQPPETPSPFRERVAASDDNRRGNPLLNPRPEGRGDSLGDVIRRYKLKQDYFGALLDGMEMDINGQMLRPPLSTLSFYCYRVASCPGLLSLPILGVEGPQAEQFAIALGMAMQLTNILRDLKEDAALGRIYLPREWLEEEGIGDITPAAIDDHYKAVTLVCISLAERAQRYYEDAESLSRELNRRRLLPVLLMRDVYQYYLRTLVSRRAFLVPHDLRLGAWRKLAILLKALRYFC